MKVTKHAKREATQLFRACVTNNALDEARAREVIDQIATVKPRDYLGILQHFRRLVHLDQERHTARVESGEPLSADLQASVKAALARSYGDGLTVLFAQNPALIAGMRIRVGSDVFDGSVRGRLTTLEKSF